MMTVSAEDSGASSGSRASTEPASRLGPPGFDPGRVLEVVRRIRDIDHWEGNGSDLIDWVTFGYVENGHGERTYNQQWRPLP